MEKSGSSKARPELLGDCTMTSEINDIAEKLTELESQVKSNSELTDALKTLSFVEERNEKLFSASDDLGLKLTELKKKHEELKDYQEKQTQQLQEIRALATGIELKKQELEEKEGKLDAAQELIMDQMKSKKKKHYDLQCKIEKDLMEMLASLKPNSEESSLPSNIVDSVYDWSSALGYLEFAKFLSVLDPGLMDRIAGRRKDEDIPEKLQSWGCNEVQKNDFGTDLLEESKEKEAVTEDTVGKSQESLNAKVPEKNKEASLKGDAGLVTVPDKEGKNEVLQLGIGNLTETAGEHPSTSRQEKTEKSKNANEKKGSEGKEANNPEDKRYAVLENALKLRKSSSGYSKFEFFAKTVSDTNKALLGMVKALQLEKETVTLRKTIASKIMFWSVTVGHSSIVELMLKNMSELKDITSANGTTPLHIAALMNHLETVKVLVERGVDINKTNFLQSSAVSTAIAQGNVRVVEILLKAGVNVNNQDVMKKSPLHFAADGNDYQHPKINRLKALELLLKAGSNKELKDETGATPLILAVFTNNADAVEILIRAGANKNAQDKLGHSALHFAVRDGQTKIFKMLLKAKVDLDLKDTLGASALHVAAYRGRTEFIIDLLQAGANGKAKNVKGQTPAQVSNDSRIKALFNSK